MKRLSSLILIIAMCWTLPVRADELFTLPDVPNATLTPMNVGDKAPYKGVLLSPSAIANIIAEYQSFDERLKLELERAEGEALAQHRFQLDELTSTCKADKAMLKASLDDANRRNDLLVKEQKKLERSRKSVLVWTMTGVAGGLLLGSLGFYGVSRLTE